MIRTLRALDIASVAVYHFVDRGAPHVAAADERFEHDDFRVGVVDDGRRHRRPVLYPERFFMMRR